jgi:hypothetical protein
MAQTVINYFKNANFDETQNFLHNVKLHVSQEYTRISGFIAYAYVAYQKQIEYEARKAAEEAGKVSEYVGQVGDKIIVDVTLKRCISYETQYGMQHIYIFQDAQDNEYKWNTAKFLERVVTETFFDYSDKEKQYPEEQKYMARIEEGEQVKVRGTIKAHEEYQGQKQTVLTRCKVDIA